MDARYPLYGELILAPSMPLAQATAGAADNWGVAIDQALSERHDIGVGDTVSIGDLDMTVSALITEQPDRNLTADWRGPPVLIAAAAIEAAGLLGPGARVDYDYKVATTLPTNRWRELFYQRFADQRWEAL